MYKDTDIESGLLDSICKLSLKATYIDPAMSIRIQSDIIWVIIRIIKSSSNNDTLSLMLSDCGLIRAISYYMDSMFLLMSNQKKLSSLYINPTATDAAYMSLTLRSIWECLL